MARSPSEATRFTATGPFAASHPAASAAAAASSSSASSSRIKLGAPAPSNETPQQKIARLRAAAALAKQAQESQFDKVVRVGRRWADRAHRVTAYSLIGLSVISGAVAVAGISDMVVHNRRRRKEWYAQQQAQSARALAEAKAAQMRGLELSDDQQLAINKERAWLEAEEAKRNKPGLVKRAKSWMFGGLSDEDRKGGRLGLSAGALERESSTEDALASASQAAQQPESRILQAVVAQGHGRDLTRSERPIGGLLDREAQSVADRISATGRSWVSRIVGQ